MQQAADIRDAVRPDEILFVVDAMIGQDAVNTANAFAEGVGFDGVVLTKLDGDARGGAALSIARVTGKPIMFASNGETLTEFDVFHPDRMASRILGMGDVLTLIEQAEKTFDAEQSAKAAGQARRAGRRVRARGLPAADADGPQDGPAVQDLRDAARHGRDEGPDQQHRRARGRPDRGDHPLDDAGERDNPKIIDGSRRARIARAPASQVSDVNNLVNRFFEARKMMTRDGRRQDARDAGAARDARHGRRPKRQQAKARKKKGARGVSGNPAKRANARAKRDRRAGGRSRPPRSAPARAMDSGQAAAEGAWATSSCRRS